MSKIITTEQALREALVDEISVAAAMSGPCQEGLMPRCRCFKCRRGRSIAALALPAPEVTIEYRVAYEILVSVHDDRWEKSFRLAASKSAAEEMQGRCLKARIRGFIEYRDIRIESREIHTGLWLPVVKP